MFSDSRTAILSATVLISIASIAGCNSATAPAPAAATSAAKPVATYPSRPAIAPPSFKLFHQTNDSLTLVTDEHATDDQIEAIIWELHDAARAHSFDKLHLPQKAIDARDPIVFFHVYRGAKCASEKYAAGQPPCGGSYHAAGDYTLGSFKNPNHEDGVLLHDETHQVELWDADLES
jgi:hypothetical protein